MKILKQQIISEKKETRYQSGLQKVVALPVQFSNIFIHDLRQLANLAD